MSDSQSTPLAEELSLLMSDLEDRKGHSAWLIAHWPTVMAALRKPESDSKRGLYEKFFVERTDGKSAPGKKHDGCEYYVLDLDHDKHAAPALDAYADSCAVEYPVLAADLRAKALTVRETLGLGMVSESTESTEGYPGIAHDFEAMRAVLLGVSNLLRRCLRHGLLRAETETMLLDIEVALKNAAPQVPGNGAKAEEGQADRHRIVNTPAGAASGSPSAAAGSIERDRCPCGEIWTEVMFAYDGPHCALDDGARFKNAAPQPSIAGPGSGLFSVGLSHESLGRGDAAAAALTDLVSLLLQTRTPIGPMRDRKDYPPELQRAIDFLHGRGSPSATASRCARCGYPEDE